MIDLPIDSPERHQAFLASDRPHLLMITNHGIHQWQIIPGLPDTGGQNVFVNQLTAALAAEGFKITIANRGGYGHPNTGEWREGVRYKDDRQRILYLEDSTNRFVRKEDMAEHIPELADFLEAYLSQEGSEVDLIISHYWDAAKLGAVYNQRLETRVKHVWVPHSLGAIKKRNVPEEHWPDLRIGERIAIERSLINKLDNLAATSATIRQSLQEDYDCPEAKLLFLPPSIDTGCYHPRQVADNDRIWHFLCQHSDLSVEEARQAKIVTEISRTDTTKRKDVLIKAFARVQRDIPNCLLVVSIDNNEEALAQKLKDLIKREQIQSHTVVVGYIRDILPRLYAVTDVYCTPSIMEGFGMSVEEAAASKTAIVASHLVPFVTEYLLGSGVEEITYPEKESNHHPLWKGEGAIVVQADEVEGFAQALKLVLANDDLRQEMAENAYKITIPRFTWDKAASEFLEEIGVATEKR